jgi:hypothetical protein
MTALTEFLFPAPARRSTSAILRWWEARRLAYNLIVGGAGVVSLGLGTILFALPPGGHGMALPWQPVVAFGVLANFCYLLGPAMEILIEKGGQGRVLPAGPTLFRMGLTFSVGLALLPILLAVIGWLFRIIEAVF